MISFRAGCAGLLFITTPALASEIMGVPEGAGFLVCYFPCDESDFPCSVWCITFPELFS